MALSERKAGEPLVPAGNVVQVVDVRNFDMTFGRMVWFMVKWAFATIPALVILIVVGVVAFSLLRGVVAGIAQGLQQARNVQPTAAAYQPSVSRPAVEYVPPPLPSVESEVTKAQQLLAAGKHMEAYAVAHSAMLRKDVTRAENRALAAIKEKAWAASRGK